MLSDQNPQPGAARARLFSALDLAHADISREFAAFCDGALGIPRAPLERLLHYIRGEFGEMVLAHAVPPTVMRSILIVGMPTPTGTLCPSLPQMPMPSSSCRSLPTILT